MRRLLLCVVFAALLIVPAAAQDRAPVPDITRYADYAPSDAVIYAAMRTDAGFRESMTALLARLEPMIGETDFNDFFEDIFNEDELFTFVGDAITLTVLSPDADFDDLLGEGSPVTISFGIRDIEAAKAFIEGGLDEAEERNGWLIYEEVDVARALLRDDVMIVSPDFAFTDQLISGDYGKLTSDARFQDTLARLPRPQYDVIAYADLSAITGTQVAPSRMDDDDPRAAAVIDLVGTAAFGGVNDGGRDLLFDAAWLYGDTGGLEDLGYAMTPLPAPEVNLSYASHVQADTLVYLQSTNLGGLLDQTFGFLNGVGAMLEGDPAVEQMGMTQFVHRSMGGVVKAGVAFGLAAATGLNLDTDVIDVLEGDFALYFGMQPDPSGAVIPSLGAVLDESGQGENYHGALVNTLDRAGYPITRIPLRGADMVLDLSAFTDPLVLSAMSGSMRNFDAANDPRYDVWFGVGGGVMALGTAPSVQFSLAPDEGSLAETAAYQHAAESVFLPGAQAIAFVNIGALEGFVTASDDRAAVRLLESVSASAFTDDAGVTGRFAVSLK